MIFDILKIKFETELNSQIDIINGLKVDRDKNEDRLRTEMRKSKAISEKISETESQLETISHEIGILKHELRILYTINCYFK